MSIRIWSGLRSHLSLRNTHISPFSSLAQVVRPQVTQLPPLVSHSARWEPPSMAEQLRSGDLNACMRLLGSYHSQVPVTADGRDLSTLRLRSATTTLIHGLIRRNQVGLASDIIAEALQGRVPESAGSSAVLPLSRRVRFRTPTLQATIANLTITGQGHSAASYLRDHRDLRRWSHVVGAQLSLTSSLLSPQNSPEAVRSREYAKRSVALLNAFRHYRYRRTDTMYDNVINACIIHGEILTATLLFVVLVKDWQMRQAVRSAIAASSSAPVPAVLDAHHFDAMDRDALLGVLDRCAKQTGHPLGEVRACGLHKVSLPYPSSSLLLRILHAIPPVKSSEGISPLIEPDPERDKHKEALAYLSVLLHESSFPPTSRVSLLIKLLSQYAGTADDIGFSPRTAQHRWRQVFAPSHERAWSSLPQSDARMLTEIVKRATRVSRQWNDADELTNAFFIQTLSRPIHQRTHSRRLDPRSYNALLSYTLTSLRDVRQAVGVLKRMHRAGWEADTVTLNTLLRGAGVLRLGGVVEAVMGVFRAAEAEGGPGVSALRLAEVLEEGAREREEAEESRSDPPRGDQGAYGSVSSSNEPSALLTRPSASRTRVAPDNYTLSSLLAHLTSTGITPPTALSFLRSITSSQPPVEMDAVLFTTLINMCAKAGMVGHVERLFFAAKEAEGEGWDSDRLRASLLPVIGTTTPSSPSALHSHSPREPTPLIVPIHAYTILLQTYARERRKRGLARGYSLDAHRSGVLGPEFVEATPRRDVALATARGVYDGVFGTALEMMDELIEVRSESAAGEGEDEDSHSHSHSNQTRTLVPSSTALRDVVASVPVPDERFFEAARKALVGSAPKWVAEDRDQGVLDEYEEGTRWEMGKRLEMDRNDLGFPSYSSAPPPSRRRLRAA